MSDVLPSRGPWGRPSWGLAICAIATVVPTLWLILPKPNTEASTFGDVAFGSAFLVPQVLALALSALRHPACRWLTVGFAGLGLTLSIAAVPLYGLGLLFVGQAGAATAVALRRAGWTARP